MYIHIDTKQIVSRFEMLGLITANPKLPNVSIPREPTDEQLKPLGFACIAIDKKPTLNWKQNVTKGGAKLEDGKWVQRWTVVAKGDDGAANLQTIKGNAKNIIDRAAGKARLAVGAEGEFVEAEYQEKEAQAKAYLADTSLTALDVPMIFANVGTSDGDTAEAVAQTYIDMSKPWKLLLANVAAVRRRAKDAVDLASTPDEIDSILESIVWPGAVGA